MRKALKHFFIPHHGNKFHPHFLHAKRALFYSLVFILVKMIVFTLVIFLPEEALLAPDVLNQHYLGIVNKTNDIRREHGVEPLVVASKLNESSQLKTEDMAENQYFSHIGLNSKTLADFLNGVKYEYLSAGENLAMGFNDADSVVSAWVQSPTHYANLIDPEFKELGVGLQGGYYEGAPTIYMAQHFGNPKFVQVMGTKIPNLNILFSAENSKAFWLESANGTMVQVKADLKGSISSVTAQIGDYSVRLTKSSDNGLYVGTTVIPKKPEYFFDPVILPSLVVIDSEGEIHRFTLDWYAPKIVSPSTIEKYAFSKETISVFTPIFSFANYIFLGFITLFIIVLSLYIFLNVKKHNYRIIGQTLAVLVLLVVLRLF